jgi:hypothetical protein
MTSSPTTPARWSDDHGDPYAAGEAAEAELAAELMADDLADDSLEGCCLRHDAPVCPDELPPPLPWEP